MSTGLRAEALRAPSSNNKDAIFLSAPRLGASTGDKPATVSLLCHHSLVASVGSPETTR